MAFDLSEAAPDVDFYLRQFLVGPDRNLTYVIGNTVDHTAVAVDLCADAARVVAEVRKDGYQVTKAMYTHAHDDHFGGVPAIADLGVRRIGLHAAAAGHPRLQAAAAAGVSVRLFRDGDRFDIGGVRVEVLHTPGHQPEAVCYLVGDPGFHQVLMTGDTLFVERCGRTDLPGGDLEAMYGSLLRIRRLPDLAVLPGHHYGERAWIRLEEARRSNPALATKRPAWDGLPFLHGRSSAP